MVVRFLEQRVEAAGVVPAEDGDGELAPVNLGCVGGKKNLLEGALGRGEEDRV